MKQRKRRAQVRWTEQLRQVLVAAYRKGGTGQAKRAIKAVRRDWSEQCIVQELNRLGLRTPQSRPRRPLGEEEQAFVLNSLGGSTFRLLAEELARPESTIWSFLRRRGYSADDQTESCKCKEVAELFGVTARQVRRWIWKWYLWTEHGRVPVESLALFVKEFGGLLPPERLPALKKWLGELLDGITLGELRESQKEVAARLGVTKGTVRDWLRPGWLQRSGKGVTWGAVARFLEEHPEEIQYNTLAPHFKEWVKRLGYRAPARADDTAREAEPIAVSAYSAAVGSA
jgi:transcriptional regulator with XRE-family HTH domain